MRRRLDTLQVELRDLADRLEDRAQLRAEALDLLVRQREPSQPGYVQHLIACDRHEPDPPKMKRAPSGAREFSFPGST